MKKATRRFAFTLVASLTAALLPFAAHADSAAASRYYEDGLKRFEARDMPGAIIQLKNALQQDRNMLAANLLLARAYLSEGDVGPAEVAFREALRLGVNRAEVAVPLARIYLLQGRGKVLLDTLPADGLPASTRLELLTLRGIAHAALGQRGDAARSFAEARALNPESPLPLAAEVPMLIGSGELALARERAELAVQKGAQHAPAYNARGSVAHAEGDLTAALEDYERAIELDPGLIDAVVARAGILVDLGRNDEAEAALTATQGGPVEPRASYLLALLAERRGDSATARKHLAEAAGLVDALPPEWVAGHEQLLMVGALAHHAGGQLEKAKAYLDTIVSRYPNNLGARKLLASINFEMKDYARATGLLEHVLRLQPADTQALYLLGRINLAQRRYAKASEYLEQAAQSGGVDAKAMLGFSRLAEGDVVGATRDLQIAFDKAPGDAVVANALANTMLRSGDAKGALVVAQRAAEAAPGNPLAFNLLGTIRLANGDAAGARAAFDNALKIQPDYLSVRLNLARLDIAEGRPEPARALYAEMLRKNRADPVAMYESGLLEQRLGNLDEAIRWFEKAVAERPDDVLAGLALIRAKAASGEHAGALEAAKALAARRNTDLGVLEALAESHIRVGDQRAAQQTLRDMTRLAGFDTPVLVRIGYLQLQAGAPGEAAYAAQKAIQGQPGNEAALVLDVEAALADPKVDGDAVKEKLAILRATHPTRPSGLRLQGDHAVRLKQYPEAEKAYLEAFRLNPSFDLLQRRASIAVALGKPASVVPEVQAWIKMRGGDARAREMLAELWMRDGNWKAARETYERLVADGNGGVNVLNNLANVLITLGEGDPVAMAEKAYALAPANVGVVDTLGWAYVRAGRLDEGLRHLRDARLRAPEDTEIRWHLGYALAKLGRVEDARVELQAALEGDPSGTWVAEAKTLLRGL